jgi:hypothetical protein
MAKRSHFHCGVHLFVQRDARCKIRPTGNTTGDDRRRWRENTCREARLAAARSGILMTEFIRLQSKIYRPLIAGTCNAMSREGPPSPTLFVASSGPSHAPEPVPLICGPSLSRFLPSRMAMVPARGDWAVGGKDQSWPGEVQPRPRKTDLIASLTAFLKQQTSEVYALTDVHPLFC